ncbi:sigma-w pathway protein ysdB [Natribacillus halophilus]|uniref:Sigma-w pathway protein ysdB n=1 Tax=Natribacillus halophilus TaxID=549003 RepID=A0A1G8LW79_9BACI|nr:sigma-w pathway protein ysdB [Natribacillus halophilus]SDI59883.1 hypothetical protein SAMN04488123_103308 [Natribacillus halophilus]
MAALLLQLLVLVALLILVYTGIRYVRDPLRKLESAHRNNEFFMHDDMENTRKNFFLTYKGAMFEGEKHVGSTENAFEVIKISMSPKRTEKLEGLQYNDFMFIEKEINDRYPHAEVEWQSPIRELIKKRK